MKKRFGSWLKKMAFIKNSKNENSFIESMLVNILAALSSMYPTEYP